MVCVGVQAGEQLNLPPSAFVTALLVPAGGAIDLERPALEAMGIRYVSVSPSSEPEINGDVCT